MKNRIVFIIAVGRSGTKWLANMLSKSDNTIVYHEPLETLSNERKIYVDKYHGRDTSVDFSKKRKFVKGLLKGNDKTYIEVNGYLRLCIPELKKAFPKCKIIHLIRNGKDVIRSMMNKGRTLLKELKNGDTYFKTACCIWDIDNWSIELNRDYLIKLETILSEYVEYQKLCNYTGINFIDKSNWDKYRKQKINNTTKFSFKSFNNFPQKDRKWFKSYCGDSMVEYGYK